MPKLQKQTKTGPNTLGVKQFFYNWVKDAHQHSKRLQESTTTNWSYNTILLFAMFSFQSLYDINYIQFVFMIYNLFNISKINLACIHFSTLLY